MKKTRLAFEKIATKLPKIIEVKEILDPIGKSLTQKAVISVMIGKRIMILENMIKERSRRGNKRIRTKAKGTNYWNRRLKGKETAESTKENDPC